MGDETATACPFCQHLIHRDVHERGGWSAANAHATALLDRYPVSEGHTLVVPHRHVESIFQLGGDERASIWNLVAEVRDRLLRCSDKPPDGFNVGPNDGVDVLACRRCNANKSDNLACVEALHRRIERNTIFGDRITNQSNAIRLPNDARVSACVAASAYEQAQREFTL